VAGREGADKFRFDSCWSNVTHTLPEAQTECDNSSQEQTHDTKRIAHDNILIFLRFYIYFQYMLTCLLCTDMSWLCKRRWHE